MAWLFADSFDFYAAITDAGTHWDTSSGWIINTAGRFTGSQCFQIPNAAAAVGVTRSSGSNDATHHIVCAFNQTTGLGGSTLLTYFQLSDGANNQVCIVFRSDGTILLTSATPGGTVLATYSSAFAAGVWNGFEFEVTIHPSAGVFKVRKNGNTSDDFSATGLNTRPGANSYANKLSLGWAAAASTFAQKTDDVLWFSTSGAAPNSWVGDIRSCQLTPVSDASAQFSKSPNPASVTPYVAGTTTSKATGLGLMAAFTASYTGTISSAILQVTTGGTGNLKAAIYDSLRVAVLATSNAVVNPATGPNTITFGTPLSVTKGTVYYFAVDTDFTIVYTSVASVGFSFSTAYASFPAASPVTTVSQPAPIFTVSIVPTVNAETVQEAQQDGLTSYVYDSTVGHADFYDLSDLPFVPVSIIGLVTRGYVEKSDAGLRQMQLQLKSGAATVQSTTLTLATSFVYTSRVDTVDPNTTAAWTAAAVNAVTVGPIVTA